MRLIKRLLLSTILVTLVLAGTAAYMADRYLHTPLAFTGDQTINIARGTHFNGLLSELHTRELIEYPLIIKAYARYKGIAHKIKAGEYRISGDMTPVSLLDHLISGKNISYTFTIVEGSTFKQVRSQLAKVPELKHTLSDLSEKDVSQKLGLGPAHPEGQFLAETYQFPRGMTDMELLKRAHQALQQELTQAWASRAEKLPYKSPYQALIMASIVEKETAVAEERPQIAGVFVKRMERGMRLQTDPTVIYGMGDQYKGNITRADLRRYTPYNTYRIDGLPPTPIAMVGREAIRASLNPLRGDWLYFVARGDGTHYFSKSLREHTNAVRRYQLKRRNDYRSTPETAK